MGEGTRDTGFMLEWMFFAEGLQEDCTICYFLRTVGEKNGRAGSLRTGTGVQGIAEAANMCVHMQGVQFVYLRFLCTHMYTGLFICVCVSSVMG